MRKRKFFVSLVLIIPVLAAVTLLGSKVGQAVHDIPSSETIGEVPVSTPPPTSTPALTTTTEPEPIIRAVPTSTKATMPASTTAAPTTAAPATAITPTTATVPAAPIKMAPGASVDTNDLQKAGFTAVKQEVPLNGRFNETVSYFESGIKTTNPSSEASNIIMVYNSLAPTANLSYTYGTDSKPFTIIGGEGKEGTLSDGRIAINFIKNGYYAVIIGPDKQKIEALATALAQKD